MTQDRRETLTAETLAGADDEQFRRALPGLQDRYIEAYNRGDVAAVCDFYTETAYVVSPMKEIVHGPPAIRRYYEDRIRAGQRFISLTTVAVVAEGPTAIEIADATVELPDADHGMTRRTRRVIAIWKRQPDGSWKLDADIFP
jgi:ketosteroid isomerase-like protein